MRLLSRRDGRLRLTQFVGRSNPPPYAILSHRWGKQSDEITFDDIEEGKHESKAGYQKVEFCLSRAESDGLEYCWIDTCCIRKSDSTELSRAINSMFRWYEEATRCYVYLYDVAPKTLSFKDSSWFARGWTLQELLAPSIVQFFDSDGTLIGDRYSLINEIHRRTRIPVEALRGAPLSKFRIEERLSWMNGRETTEEEDEAYALLGIFGIHMPLIYGEGRVDALKRLREEIHKSSQAQNQLTFPGNRPDTHEEDIRCLRAWRLTDPRDDKGRILANKDQLLHGSCDWIDHDAAFIRWWQSEKASILWLHGDPGKGKTMLMMALTEKIAHHSPSGIEFVSFFFCQDTVQELSNTAAVLRGLTYLLAAEHPGLRHHLRSKFEEAGDKLFEGFNVLHSMWDTLSRIAQDPSVSKLYLLVDALDECDRHSVSTFFRLLSQAPLAVSRKIKWILSSRNLPYIREYVQSLGVSQDTSLELNSSHVAKAVTSFIDSKVNHLTPQKRYGDDLRSEVQKHLQDNADDTFLWVALACKELEKLPSRRTLEALRQLPPGLEPLYRRMLDQVENHDDQDDKELCLAIIRTATVTYRPLHVEELGRLAGFDEKLAVDTQAVQELVSLCGSFLTVRNQRVFFIHQSAKDFFVSGSGSRVLGDHKAIHDMLTKRLVSIMSRSLTTDVCGLKAPGVLLEEIDSLLIEESLPPHVQYSCQYWGAHATEQQSLTGNIELIQNFLEKKFLNWLEALSLIGRLAHAVHTMTALLESCQSSQAGQQALRELFEDARRFILRARSAIEESPLQVYSSAMIFTPTESLIRHLYINQLPSWITVLSPSVHHWGACLQTFRFSRDPMRSVIFSQDGRVIVSLSFGNSVRVCDTATGSVQYTFNPSSALVSSIGFHPDAGAIAAGYDKNSVMLWDTATRSLLLRLEGHSDLVLSTVLSSDSKTIASTSRDGTLRLWDAVTGSLRLTLETRTNMWDPVFSRDSQMVASISDMKYDMTGDSIYIWNVTSGSLLLTLEVAASQVPCMAFSMDGQAVAVVRTHGMKVELWDIPTRSLRCTINDSEDCDGEDEIASLSFSPDGQLIAFGCDSGKLLLINAITGSQLAELHGHSDVINAISFSPDSRTIATAAGEGTAKLWDVAKAMTPFDFQGRRRPASNYFNSVRFSHDGRFVGSIENSCRDEIKERMLLVDTTTEQQFIESSICSDVCTKNFSIDFDNYLTIWRFSPHQNRAEDNIELHEPWICSMHERLLRLPDDHLVLEHDIWGSKIAFTCGNHRMVILDFKLPPT